MMKKYLALLIVLWSLGTVIYAQSLTPVYKFARETDAFTNQNIAFSVDGKYLAYGLLDGTVKVMDMNTGLEACSFTGHEKMAISVAFSPDSVLLASGGKDRTIRIWDLKTRTQKFLLEGHFKAVMCLSFSPDGLTLFSGSRDNSIILWDVPTGKEIKKIEDITGNIKSIIFSPDGKYLICATSALMKGIRYFDLQTGKEVKTLEAPNTLSLAINPDESMIVSGSLHNEIQLWNTQTGQNAGMMPGHKKYVQSVAFSPMGKVLVSGSDDNSVRLWDFENRKNPYVLNGHTNAVIAVAYSPDGAKVASSSWDKSILVWDVSKLDLPKENRYHKPDNDLPPEEIKILDNTFRNLEFETGSAQIRASSNPSLNELALLLGKKPAYKLVISGHTDNVGDATFNFNLSNQRAEAVKQYLTSKQVVAARITTQGYGATKPVADNRTEEGKQKNRRVEFLVVK